MADGEKNNLHETLTAMTEAVCAFRDERDWKQFHVPKDMAISLCLEAAEVLEHFQWSTSNDMVKQKKTEIGDELADVLYWVLLMAHDFEIDLPQAFAEKLKKTGEKYPIEKSRGRSDKYSKL